MMSHLQIMSEIDKPVDIRFNWRVALKLFGAVFGITLAISIIMRFFIVFIAGIIVLSIGFIISLCVGYLAGRLNEQPTSYEKWYKVRFKDGIDMQNFYAEYEIVKKDGDVYTIRERRQKENYYGKVFK